MIQFNAMNQRIPVIMYHSVGVVNSSWHWHHLTCPYKVFEDQLKWIKKFGYSTLNFQEVYDHIILDKPIPKRSVFLTFDDGYLDNYVFAYPLLKKYGFKGTIFVNPDFVDESEKLRKTIDNFRFPEEIESLDIVGFCNWYELKKMDSEGILDVQSHAKTHTWYPVSDKIIDFRHPGDEYIWMDWNEFPEEKSKLQLRDLKKIKFGLAIFEHEKALSSKRVFINSKFQNSLHEYVKKNGDELFFENSGWKDLLTEFSNQLNEKIPIIDQLETQDEYLDRIRFELGYTKKLIEEKLNKEVNFLCWPGGSATKDGLAISMQLGYLMSTAAKDLSDMERKSITNSSADKINRIVRFTPVFYHFISKKSGVKNIRYSPGWFFLCQIWRFEKKYYARYWVKFMNFCINKIVKYV